MDAWNECFWDDPLEANPKTLLDFNNLKSYPIDELHKFLERLTRMEQLLKAVIATQNTVVHPFSTVHAVDKMARVAFRARLSEGERKQFDDERAMAKKLRDGEKSNLVANTLAIAKIMSELERRNAYYV